MDYANVINEVAVLEGSTAFVYTDPSSDVPVSIQAETGENYANFRGWDTEHVSRDSSNFLHMVDQMKEGHRVALIVYHVKTVASDGKQLIRLANQAAVQDWALVITELGLDTSTPSGQVVITHLASVSDDMFKHHTGGISSEARRFIIQGVKQRWPVIRITDELNANGIPAPGGRQRWTQAFVRATGLA